MPPLEYVPICAEPVDLSEIRAGDEAVEADGPVLEVPDRSEDFYILDLAHARVRYHAGMREFLVAHDHRTPPDTMVLFMMLAELRLRMLSGLGYSVPRSD